MPRRADEGCCPECGLFAPCKTCGKPRLGLAVIGNAPPIDDLVFTRDEVLAAMRVAFDAGLKLARGLPITATVEHTHAPTEFLSSLLGDLYP